MDQTVVGLFDNLSDAQRVVKDLVDAGFSRDRISLVAGDAANEYSKYVNKGTTTTTTDDVTAGEGAGFGAVVGALTGIIAGLGALAIPGIGPVLAAGPLLAAATGGAVGAVAGAATGGVVAGLVKTGVPEEDAQYYAEGIRRGGTLVTVHAPENMARKAYDIMNRDGAVNIDERVASWKQSGWKGFDANAKPYTAAEINKFRQSYSKPSSTASTTTQKTTTNKTQTTQPATQKLQANEEKVLPVVEEELQVGKREVEKGSVRVYQTVTEKPVQEQVTLREEHVNVERRPVDRAVSSADTNAFKEQSFEMTEHAEQPVVSKQARVIEEVVIGKEVTQHTETINDTVRRTDVKVEQTGTQRTGSTQGMTTGYDVYANDFQTHYNKNFGKSGYSFDQYSPAYRYGYNLASDKSYANRNWTDIEPSIRDQWESRNKGTWEEFKDAIKYGWERVKNAARGATR
jgi:uncharacterized protein (TIGR02271 family)